MAGRTLADIAGIDIPSKSIFSAPWPYLLAGVVLLAAAVAARVSDSVEARSSDEARASALRVAEGLETAARELQAMLRSDAVQDMAESVMEGSATGRALLDTMRRAVPDIRDVSLHGSDAFMADLDGFGAPPFVTLDMLAAAEADELSPVQFVAYEGVDYVAGASTIGRAVQGKGFIVAFAGTGFALDRVSGSVPASSSIGIEQLAGVNTPASLKQIGSVPPVGARTESIRVPGTLFQVVYPAGRAGPLIGPGGQRILLVLSVLFIVLGLVRWRASRAAVPETETMPESFDTMNDSKPRPVAPVSDLAMRQKERQRPGTKDTGGPRLGKISEPNPSAGGELPPFPGEGPASAMTPPPPKNEEEPPSLRPRKPGDDEATPGAGKPAQAAPPGAPPPSSPPGGGSDDGVPLKSEIFRAYDIRGVVGKTLDRGIAFRVGQAIGSLALDSLATPVVVGRDGRHSGPELAAGMAEGIASTGCEVVDVGAVPTGALYYAAAELGNGSGVMVTGSHNPPDYNGFKIMIGGRTLAGNDIFGLFERIRTGNLRQGQGEVRGQDVLTAYRDRIAGDIRLERPLKVVADCGNGIGGVCASEVLRAIGAEVVPLYEDVDGDFPNHHPDPSEPENLEDLIESVRLSGADLGVAFDGDADRLGVVTPDGKIVYADRIMMLYVREVLSRNPGAVIIYDVKCTGHLDQVIRDAGGDAQMYKTGHSLIKNRMKEVDAPFAGEMSGHFFFKDRWYGFDCGIYAACRLLEILASEERTPAEVLGDLPDSVSTPELKVQLKEGENHAFIDRFRREAEFPGARITTIDGLRADFDDGWGLVRASNTTPILVLRFDADNEAALDRIKGEFREQLLDLKPDMTLPF